MKKLSTLLLLVPLSVLAFCVPCEAQLFPRLRARWSTPVGSCANGQCSRPAAVQSAPVVAAVGDDTPEIMQALASGFAGRPVLGRYRDVSLAGLQFHSDGDHKAFIANYQAAIGRLPPNPQRKCNLATFAVAMTPVMIEMMDPNMPPAQLAEIVYGLELAQAVACGTPVPTPPVTAKK